MTELLEKYPELDNLCREKIKALYKEMLGSEPLTEMLDYVMTIGVKNNTTRTKV